MMISRIGIVGAGQMGSGIAQISAQAGFDVVLQDINQAQIDKALEIISANYGRQLAKGKMAAADRDAAMARIRTEIKLDPLGDCDLVIEAASENEALKRKIYTTLCPVLRKDAVLATNTSSISVTRLAAATDRPEKFMGMHFMNPVPVMQLVELIRGIATDEPTFQTVREVAVKLGKTPANAEDFPAFIVNRILLPMINEAIYTLYEGVGGVQVLYEGLADSKYRPCPLLVKYVEAGWLGRKAQRGFYDYRGPVPQPTR
jgi:3-hydroxybutyryl-CoA dehydrogenase